MEEQQEANLQADVHPLNNGPDVLGAKTTRVMTHLSQRKQLCDAVIRLCDGGHISIHRVFLIACSMYFRALFTTKLHTVCKTDVEIPEVTTEEMKLVVDYAYLRPVPLNEANVYRMLVVADYLCVTGLHDICTDFLIRMLSPRNCIHIMLFARLPSCNRLETAARRFALRHFQRIDTETTALMGLSVPELTDLLSTDWLNVQNEKVVWYCVLRWTSVNPDARLRYLPLLMRCVRLGLLDLHFFQRDVRSHPYVQDNGECRPVVLETLMYLYRREDERQRNVNLSAHPLARPRVPYEVILAIGGWTGRGSTACFEMYNTRADEWSQVLEKDPAGPRAYHEAVVIGSDVYVIGGFNGQTFFRSCRCFRAVTQQWSDVAPMNYRRCYVSAAALGEAIYAIGGYDGTERLRSVERYVRSTNQWSLVCPTNFTRSDASAAALQGKVYVAGGFDGQSFLRSAEVYDPVEDQWTLIQEMHFPRSGVSCITYYGCIYAVGGNSGSERLRSAERYDPDANVWTLVSEMYTPRSNFGIAIIDNMIFAIGGYDGTSTTLCVECYIPDVNEWYGADNLKTSRSALATCVVAAPELQPPRDSWWQLSMSTKSPFYRRREGERLLMPDNAGDSSNC